MGIEESKRAAMMAMPKGSRWKMIQLQKDKEGNEVVVLSTAKSSSC